MKRIITIATTTVLTVLVALTLSVAAQLPDTHDRTIMTFSGAVELPSMKLEPGTYVFRLADTDSRNVIQVLSGDQKDILGQWLFVPAERLEVTGDTVVTFRETSAGATPAVQYWYYPGEKTGKEFIYPKDQATRIAARTGATVLSDEGPITTSTSVQAEAQPSSALGTDAVAVEAQGSGVIRGSGLPETQAEAVGTTGTADQTPATSDTRVRQESTVVQNDTYAQPELPRTASPLLPLSGLIALLSLAGAAGIRAFRW